MFTQSMCLQDPLPEVNYQYINRKFKTKKKKILEFILLYIVGHTEQIKII